MYQAPARFTDSSPVIAGHSGKPGRCISDYKQETEVENQGIMVDLEGRMVENQGIMVVLKGRMVIKQGIMVVLYGRMVENQGIMVVLYGHADVFYPFSGQIGENGAGNADVKHLRADSWHGVPPEGRTDSAKSWSDPPLGKSDPILRLIFKIEGMISMSGG